MVREQQACGNSRREEKQGAKVMKAQAVSSPTRPQHLNMTRLVVKSGSAESKSSLDKHIKKSGLGPPGKSSQEARLQQQPKSMTAEDRAGDNQEQNYFQHKGEDRSP